MGQILLYQRQSKFAGELISIGGIGAVRVATDYRSQGIASQMMTVAMAELKQLNCDVAFLCTNIDSFLADFYKNYGFQIYPQTYFFQGRSGQFYQANNGMLAPVNSSQIFAKIIKSKKQLDFGVGIW